jgi:hypothetical protein
MLASVIYLVLEKARGIFPMTLKEAVAGRVALHSEPERSN